MELVQTLLHHLFQLPLPLLVAAAFVLSQLLFCFSWQFRAPKSPEAPTGSPALSSYTTQTLTQHPPLDRPTAPPAPPRAPGTIPLPSPSRDPCDHPHTADLLQHSPSPDKARLALVLGLTHNNSHTRLVFQKVFTQASLLQYTHLVHLNAEEIFLKRKIKVWPLLEEVEAVLLLGFFFSLQLITSSPLFQPAGQYQLPILEWHFLGRIYFKGKLN